MPGASRISVPIQDWPEVLAPGTLNIRITSFPEEYLAVFGGPSVRHLDSRRFLPEAELAFEEIEGNTLPPNPSRPDRGRAQIWRANLHKVSSGGERLCWVLRRIGSGLKDDLECVAGESFRAALSLANGDEVVLRMKGAWSQQ